MLIGEKTPVRIGAPDLRTDPFRPGFRLTVFTGLRNLFTTPPGIERVIDPFQFGIFSHAASKSLPINYLTDKRKCMLGTEKTHHLDAVGKPVGER